MPTPTDLPITVERVRIVRRQRARDVRWTFWTAAFIGQTVTRGDGPDDVARVRHAVALIYGVHPDAVTIAGRRATVRLP